MLGYILSYIRKYNEAARFNNSDPLWRQLVFYSHGPEDWLVIEPIMLELIHQFKKPISFVTANPQDPIRHMPPIKIAPYLIGSGKLRERFLERMECDTMVVSNESALKKPFPISPNVKNYTCFFPSLKSVRATVCEENLANFSTFLCSANHQLLDLQDIQQKTGRNYQILPCGTTRMDRALKIAEDSRRVGYDKTPTIFVAFFDPALDHRDTTVSPIVQGLLDADYRVILRPPQQWIDRKGNFIRPIYERFASRDLFFPDGEQASGYSIYRADCLITDNADLALELSITLEYPFVLLDLGQSSGAERVEHSFESTLQSYVGPPITETQLDQLPKVVAELLKKRNTISTQLKNLRTRELINPARAALTAAFILTNKFQMPAVPQPVETTTPAV
ncbi:MAG: hypothetical protein HYZ71_05825 [Deltaproteobacteria bacterium]|nr:hypothetical protein [Deltaproteobacteria bacterium]